MGKRKHLYIKAIPTIIISLFALFLVTGCGKINPDPGTLTGNVTIGPLCPVEPCDITQEQIDLAYSERKLLIYPATDTSRVVKKVDVYYNKPYRVDLLPGTYIVDINNHIGMDRSGDVPAKVTIRSNVTDTLDIDIDTGIR